MIKFSFLKGIKENSNYKKIKVSFDSTIDGYEIIENKGTFELIGMNTETCKLKNFEKEVKKFIRREIYHQTPEINALTDLSLDFRLNHVYISGKKSIIKKIDIIDIKENKDINKSKSIQKMTNNITNESNNSKDTTKEKINKPNKNINNKSSQNKNTNNSKKKKNNSKKKRKRKNKKR